KEIKVPVVFVGKQTSSYMTELNRFIKENELGTRITFLSHIPEADLAALYQTAALSVYISVFEGFGLPVIESMASGCPVVTSSVSVLPETAGDAAVLCNPAKVEEIAQKVALLLDTEDFRNEIIEKGKQRSNLF